MQLIFHRRVTKRTPGRFRTRVITEGVTPSLHVDYKHSRIKQCHKEGRALRTETTINDAYDFGLRKGLQHLPALRAVGFAANRRLLDVQRTSHACAMAEDQFARLNRPQRVGEQRVSALPFADPVVQALLATLVQFCFVPQGFANREVRERLAQMLGLEPSALTAGRMTYHLRRLRLHGLIERVPHRHRYRLTDEGQRTALFCTRVYHRVLRPGLTDLISGPSAPVSPLRTRFRALEAAIADYVATAKVA